VPPSSIERNHLSAGVDARICPPGANDTDRLLSDGRDDSLQCLLDSPLTLSLSLKAVKVSTIVFNNRAVSPGLHWLVVWEPGRMPAPDLQREIDSLLFHQLEHRHLGPIADPTPNLDQASIPSGSLHISRSDLREQARDGLVTIQPGSRKTSRVDLSRFILLETTFGQSDQFLSIRLDCPGLGLGRLYLTVEKKLGNQVSPQGTPVRWCAPQNATSNSMSHLSYLLVFFVVGSLAVFFRQVAFHLQLESQLS
jgi:hypothetical protein